MSVLPDLLRKKYLHQKYQLYGKQIAIKKCRWSHSLLVEGRPCYKGYYGIQSHRCIQSTPNLICDHQCLFCWRIQESDLGIESQYKKFDADSSPIEIKNQKYFDSPDKVIEGLLWGWRRIISGYGAQVGKSIPEERYAEAKDPKHITFSLAGEPFFYPYLPELIAKLKDKDFTVFIVTNGTVPETIQQFIDGNIYPTQLYVTVPAPDKQTYQRTCRPEIKNGWIKILETLDIIGSNYPERTVGRLTVAKNINLTNAKGYATILNHMKPSFIEVKGAVHVGSAQIRLERQTMPYHEDILEFTTELQQHLSNYELVGEKADSLVTILSNNKHPLLIPGLKSMFN
ncbi:MAG: radical SAM protein [Promethearchaeota archaeon]